MNVSTPPDWLVFAAPAIALVALMISILALTVSYRSFRESRPQVRVSARGYGRSSIEIRISNRFAGKIEIDSVHLVAPSVGTLAPAMNLSSLLSGEALPYELAERRSRVWTVDLNEWITSPRRVVYHNNFVSPNSESSILWLPAEIRGFRVIVKLGDGREKRARVKRLSPWDIEKLWRAEDVRRGELSS